MNSSLNWSDIAGLLPEDVPLEKPAAPKYPVSTWTRHDCKSKHRTGEAFMKCSGKWEHNGEKLTKNSRSFIGTGEWAVTHSHYSGDYYTVHNNKRLNHGHMVENIHMFDTYEEARDYLTDTLGEPCYMGECTGPCKGLSRTIIHISL
jgi:hypothetical protein